MSNMFHGLNQGNNLLMCNQNKTARTMSVKNKQSAYDSFIKPVSSFFFREQNKEGFENTIKQQVGEKNKKQQKRFDKYQKRFNEALREYGRSNVSLMEETTTFLNTSNKSQSYSGKLVKLSGSGAVGYVTDKGMYKYIPNDSILKDIQGKYGCPSEITTISSSSKNYNSPGKMLGTKPNLFVGTPMKKQSCGITGTNIQVVGATNPETNMKSWKGCMKSFKHNMKPLSGVSDKDPNQAIEKCKVAAADLGRKYFMISKNSNGMSECYISEYGKELSEMGGEVATKSVGSYSVIEGNYNKDGRDAVGMLNNGQLALGRLSSGSSNDFVGGSGFKTWDVNGIKNCDPKYGAKIIIESGSYGANCNGKTDPLSLLR